MRRSRTVLLSSSLAVATAFLGCFSNGGSGDAGTADAGPDVLFGDDAAPDATTPADAPAETTAETGTDAGNEAAVDSSAPHDAAVDAPAEAAIEAGADAPVDAPAEAGTLAYYVDPVNGLDTNAGTSAAPWKTIYHATIALGQVDAGAATITVYLADGTYDSSNQTNFWGTFTKPTFVRGSAPGNVILSGTYAGEALYFAAGGGIANVTFHNTTTSFQVQGGTFTASGIGFDGLPGFNNTTVSFLGNTVATLDTVTVTNMNTAGGQDLATLVYGDNTANVTWHATGTAITSPATSPGNAIFARGGAQLAIDGLVLTNFPGFAAVIYDQAQLTLTNSTLSGCGPAPGTCSGTGCRASIWLGGSQTGIPTGVLNLTGTSITGSPGSAVGYTTTSNTGAVSLTMTNSHLDNNAYAGLWIGGATNPALAMNVTASGTTFDGNQMSGITSGPAATISITGGSISNNGAGAGALGQTPGAIVLQDGASASSLTMRNVTVASDVGSFLTVVGSAQTTLDLGTTASPGGLTFSGVAAGIGAAALKLSAPIAATAVGNTWMPNMQGSDASGHFTSATTLTGPTSGLNVNLVAGSSVVLK